MKTRTPSISRPALLALAPLLLTLSGGAISCAPASASGGPDPVAAATTMTVEERVQWQPALAADTNMVVTLPAEVVLPSNARQTLAPFLSGRLESWHLRPGQHVRAGEPLATLTSPGLSQTTAAIARIRQERVHISEQIDALQPAVDRGIRPIDDVLSLRAELGRLGAQLTELQQAAAIMRRSAGGATEGASWTWTAAQDAYVSDILCAVGDNVQDSEPCIELVDLRGALVRVEVPERYVALHPPGPDTTLNFVPTGAMSGSETLSWFRSEPWAESDTRSVSVYFSPSEGSLIPGTTGRGTIAVPAPENAIQVPAGTLTSIGGEEGVIVQGDGDLLTSTFVPVQRLGRSGDGIVVWAPGLQPGTPIAYRGVFLLKSILLMQGE
jgi:cobalt-zinc-cadmium efflux system membrane fusion protein